MKTPVALFIFNRPETTAQVFAQIAAQRPEQLFLIADGPRPDRPDEAERCRQARRAVSRVDWPCRVHVNFSGANLGCGRRMSSGLTWVFEQVEEAIILEDDCLPCPDFFRFCEEMLARYRHDARIGIISGDNFLPSEMNARIGASYYFTRYLHIWGWASWRRTWRQYDFATRLFPKAIEEDWLGEIFERPQTAQWWARTVYGVHSGQVDTWDHQFVFAGLINSWLNVMPTVNLVSNIGFGPDATHAVFDSPIAARPAGPLAFPLRHPEAVIRSRRADDYMEGNVFRIP